MLLLIFLLLIIIFFKKKIFFFSLQIAPVIRSIKPDSGPATGVTTVVIHGQYFGGSADEIVDVTISGYSCRFSLTWFSTTQVKNKTNK